MASHHGKLRMTIRVMPEERPPKDPKCLFACGIWQGDSLPETALGNGEDGLAIVAPQVSEIDVTPMRMGSIDGHPSWSQRMLSLRDSHRGHATQEDSFGPFKLAFLEAILRAADMRASKAAEQRTLARSGDAI
jgi:CRISPR-associated endonuclease/helicase Cas3